MPDGVIVLDKQNRIVDINPAAQHFMLIDPRDAIGQPVMDFLPKVLAGLFDPTGRNIASYEILAPDQKTQVNVYATPLSAKGREARDTGHAAGYHCPKKRPKSSSRKATFSCKKRSSKLRCSRKVCGRRLSVIHSRDSTTAATWRRHWNAKSAAQCVRKPQSR